MNRHLAIALFALLALAMLLPACTAAPAPTPTIALAKATSAPAPTAAASPAAKASAVASPAANPSAVASPATSADWKAKWDEMVAAAKKEGKVVIAGGPGDIYRTAAMAFQQAYPEIQVEFTGMMGRDFAPKVLAEREGGQYLWDVHVDGTTPPLTLRDKGALDSIKASLALPEVLDDSKWLGGLDDGWTDKEKQYVYALEGRLSYLVYVNRDIVPESELSSHDQLLDPKWKGKIVTTDPRLQGPAALHFGHILLTKGEDWLRKFLGQDLAIQNEERAAAEAIVRGRYPIAIGVDNGTLGPFVREGAANAIKPLDPDSVMGATISTGFGNATLLNKAPHPNAARVYLNWFFSQEGQKAYVEATSLNSRRLDVAGPPETTPKPNVKYSNLNKEEFVATRTKLADIAKELIK